MLSRSERGHCLKITGKCDYACGNFADDFVIERRKYQVFFVLPLFQSLKFFRSICMYCL
ncbi:hypothetical protein BVRB_4g071810 [Beta vulgaris subsp. vulgaris]|nr:hypothetical protein BVRB_4g071810 [Beta vulgaris subsp. vulgaris]